MQQRPQNAGGGPPQQGPGQGPGQGMMGFQPQMMGFQPQMMQGGQGGHAMMVPMMMPAGQHPGNFAAPQGMQGMQAQQGQPNQQGQMMQQGGPQQGQMMQQMYRQQWGQEDPRRQMTGRSG